MYKINIKDIKCKGFSGWSCEQVHKLSRMAKEKEKVNFLQRNWYKIGKNKEKKQLKKKEKNN